MMHPIGLGFEKGRKVILEQSKGGMVKYVEWWNGGMVEFSNNRMVEYLSSKIINCVQTVQHRNSSNTQTFNGQTVNLSNIQ
jgi:hypothetical protein